MYVRWKKRPYSDRLLFYRGERPKGHLLSVSLVESKRVNGKPRQHHIAYLGSIDVWLGDPLPYWLKREVKTMLPLGGSQPGLVPPFHAEGFWQQVTKSLGSLSAQIGPDARADIKAAIAAVIPQIDPLAMKYLRQECKAHDEKVIRELQGDGLSAADRFEDTASAMMLGLRGVAKAMLALPPESTESEIRAVYRRLSELTHPDHAGDPQLFSLVSRVCGAALGKGIGVVDTRITI